MQYAYDILLKVRFKHSYFSANVFSGFSVVPTKECRTLMHNTGLIFKPSPTSFSILYESSNGAVSKSRANVVKTKDVLSFIVTLNDPFLFNYTEQIGAGISDSVFVFTNILPDGKSFRTSGLLHNNDFVSQQDSVALSNLPDKYFNKPFGIINIGLHENVEDELSISFSARSAYWSYFLVNTHLLNLNNPGIISQTGDVTFSDPTQVDLPTGSKALLIKSLSAIVMKEIQPAYFQLIDRNRKGDTKHKVIISALPVPSVNTISNVTKRVDKEATESYVEVFL